MTNKEKFIYCPELLTFKEYLDIALSEAQKGKFLPCYYYKKAAQFSSKFHKITKDLEKWEGCYFLRIKRYALIWHKYKYSTIKT